ncbi:uncharacterized protein LOC131869695 [Cryptomeria japonica]|uniref:uncharacterized protein LOC131869695 n=1 Tax=Cryptomeria japonica TaxID=3369 RepID=UPI0027DA04E7|nr:uncharacterized protein LOC131869695 [Cryptomeria japonica]
MEICSEIDDPLTRVVQRKLDGASKGNPRVSEVGIVIRDWLGNLVMGAQKLSVGTNNEAEAKAAILAIRWGLKLGIQNFHLEGDSRIIINAIIKGEAQAWHLNKFIFTIANDLKLFNNYCISHVRKEGNYLVHAVSTCTSKWVTSFAEEDEIHVEDLRDLTMHEVDGGVQHCN